MGYFSNGTEGMDYQERYCVRCVHGQHPEFGPADCPVQVLHFLYNYDQHNKTEPGPTIKVILEGLIPMSQDRPHNLECKMFKEAK